VTHCSFLLSLSYQALGLPDRAREVADSINKFTFERGNKMFISLAEAFLADLDLRQGHIVQAEQWVKGFVPSAPHGLQRFFNAELTSIRVMMALDTPQSRAAAAEQLDSFHQLVKQIHHKRLMIDVLGMKALLADTLSQESSAFEKLNEALTLAEPGEFIRPFLDLGHPMSDLLKRCAKQNPDQKYTEKILAAFSNEETGMGQEVSDDQTVHRSFLSKQALVEPLTNREIEILLILSKRLSNQEIAESLFISPETVKRHLSNIYQKFDIKNRQQAIVKAKSLGIL
jgi:LuxR family maltose regulon positive regulatory protein